MHAHGRPSGADTDRPVRMAFRAVVVGEVRRRLSVAVILVLEIDEYCHDKRSRLVCVYRNSGPNAKALSKKGLRM